MIVIVCTDTVGRLVKISLRAFADNLAEAIENVNLNSLASIFVMELQFRNIEERYVDELTAETFKVGTVFLDEHPLNIADVLDTADVLNRGTD